MLVNLSIIYFRLQRQFSLFLSSNVPDARMTNGYPCRILEKIYNRTRVWVGAEYGYERECSVDQGMEY
jgi:hypothetical protein